MTPSAGRPAVGLRGRAAAQSRGDRPVAYHDAPWQLSGGNLLPPRATVPEEVALRWVVVGDLVGSRSDGVTEETRSGGPLEEDPTDPARPEAALAATLAAASGASATAPGTRVDFGTGEPEQWMPRKTTRLTATYADRSQPTRPARRVAALVARRSLARPCRHGQRSRGQAAHKQDNSLRLIVGETSWTRLAVTRVAADQHSASVAIPTEPNGSVAPWATDILGCRPA
jgi:hypothetical protein